MSKVTADQILTLKTRIDNGDVTVTQGCKNLGVSPVTYYRRLKALVEKSEECKEIVRNVTDTLPITINSIQTELQGIISELKEMKAKDTSERLRIIDRQTTALDKLLNTIKTTNIMIDNRSLTVNLDQKETIIEAWVRDELVPMLYQVGMPLDMQRRLGEMLEARGC